MKNIWAALLCQRQRRLGPAYPCCGKGVVCLFFLLWMVTPVRAQAYTISTDLQKINLAMFNAGKISMQMEYILYFDTEVRSRMTGIVKKEGKLMFQQVGAITVVKNNDYSVFVHDDKKLIVVDPNIAPENSLQKNDILRINTDSLKNWILASEITASGSNRVITFTLKKGEYSRMILVYDPQTYFLKRMELHARETHQSPDGKVHTVSMQVIFNKTELAPQFTPDEFSQKKYVNIIAKDNIILTPEYKKYTLINNLDKGIIYGK